MSVAPCAAADTKQQDSKTTPAPTNRGRYTKGTKRNHRRHKRLSFLCFLWSPLCLLWFVPAFVGQSLLVEGEGIKRISRSRQYILAAIDRIGFRSIRHLADIAVPKHFSVCRIERNQVPGNVAGEKQSSRRGQQSRGSRIISQ